MTTSAALPAPTPDPTRSPEPDASAATRVQLRWGNLAIAATGGLVAVVAAAWIMLSGSPVPQAGARGDAPAADGTTVADRAADGTLTQADAVALVEDARSLMTEARWDDAAARLALVPQEYRGVTNADSVQMDLDSRRQRHDGLRAELAAQVEAQQWREAAATLEALAKIARLDDELQAVDAQVQAALGTGSGSGTGAALATAANAAGTTDVAAPQTDTDTTTGGSTTTSTPAPKPPVAPTTSTTSRPTGSHGGRPTGPRPGSHHGGSGHGSGSGSRPHPSRPAPATSSPAPAAAATGPSLDSIFEELGGELTDAQLTDLEASINGVLPAAKQRELEAALRAVLSSKEMAKLQTVLGGTVDSLQASDLEAQLAAALGSDSPFG